MLISTVTAQLICSFPFAHAVGSTSDAVNIIPYSNEMKCSSLKWGALLVILGDMGSTGNYFRELGSKFIALGI